MKKLSSLLWSVPQYHRIIPHRIANYFSVLLSSNSKNSRRCLKNGFPLDVGISAALIWVYGFPMQTFWMMAANHSPPPTSFAHCSTISILVSSLSLLRRHGHRIGLRCSVRLPVLLHAPDPQQAVCFDLPFRILPAEMQQLLISVLTDPDLLPAWYVSHSLNLRITQRMYTPSTTSL